MADLLTGAVTVYHDRRYEKEALEQAITENLEQLRQNYPRQSMKNLEAYFQDTLKISFQRRTPPQKSNQSLTNTYLVSYSEGKQRSELSQILQRDCSIGKAALPPVLDALESVVNHLRSAGGQAAAQLLKKVHYSQLINFDFKFASKPSHD